MPGRLEDRVLRGIPLPDVLYRSRRHGYCIVRKIRVNSQPRLDFAADPAVQRRNIPMAKSSDIRKEQKKAPQKSAKEKRQAKREKKGK